MATSPEIQAFKFPTWQEIEERNRPFLERGEYKGYNLQVPVTDNLHLLIDCQNDSCVFPTSSDVIRFAWCTNNGFAISSVKYKNCEPGYIMGCTHLINAANEFKKAFEEFTSAHVRDIRKRIDIYNAEHPEPETPAEEAPEEGDR
ncbi:MAG: hypothetical protein IJZ68_08185 [Bacteroidaceae bacterium]|nr:hypothetical protein [Bacteroidaceae bacterium]